MRIDNFATARLVPTEKECLYLAIFGTNAKRVQIGKSLRGCGGLHERDFLCGAVNCGDLQILPCNRKRDAGESTAATDIQNRRALREERLGEQTIGVMLCDNFGDGSNGCQIGVRIDFA